MYYMCQLIFLFLTKIKLYIYIFFIMLSNKHLFFSLVVGHTIKKLLVVDQMGILGKRWGEKEFRMKLTGIIT